MTLDYRVYATIYTILCLAWFAALPMSAFCEPRTVGRYMLIVAGTGSIIGALNIIDWLWS